MVSKFSQRFKSTKDISSSLKYERFPPSRDETQLQPWPRRLLHVASMTSYEWQSGNKYNGVKEPSYNAISYTWGRYEDPSEAPINISGLTWKVPGIKKSHFTVSEFEQALKTTANKGAFIWVDIACIDQENEAVKMAEINNQAAIYQRAREVFAWMVPWATSDMSKAYYTIEKYAESIGYIRPDGHPRLEPSNMAIQVDIESVSRIFQGMAQQGWFTSLWTLQEAFLSRPFFLSKSSELVYYRPFFGGKYGDNKFPVGISYVTGGCRDIWDILRFSNDPHARSICQSITDSGLFSMYFFREPYLLYPAALKRYVSLPQDSFYAIMHVWGIQMPTMDDADRLLLKLAIYTNSTDPLSYQIFVHETPVRASEAWRMSRTTHLPFQFFNSASIEHYCTIKATTRDRPEFSGNMTTLDDIALYWAATQQQRRGSQKVPYRPNVFLDAVQSSNCVCLELEDHPPAIDHPHIPRQDDKYTQKWPLQDLARRFPFPLKSYCVLLLGSRSTRVFQRESPGYRIGLIVRQEESGKNKPWYRVGFCSWLTQSLKDPENGILGVPDKISVPYRGWTEITCLIG
ncbi:hypothetical protein V496_03866 [Pseudogymnoascus sp. VKM F-4515 (FW-2607)]|nr:hypothetical protein V496_03866 [Pseudogymnoascus sp. VKM F-4515 (FW-2607)]